MAIQENNRPVLKPFPTQQMAHIINANTTYALCQRAGGKTMYVIGLRLQHLNEVMPRCQVLLFSDTYERLIDRIVPNIVYFWEKELKWVEGVDYVKYKKPPEHFTRPIIPMDKFDKVISTADGMAICLVSLSVEGSANAYNAQAVIGDEVKYCDETKINTEVLPALRGLEEYYKDLPEFQSVWMTTDKFGGDVGWLLKKKKLVNQKAVDVIYAMQMQVVQWQNEMMSASSTATQYKYKEKIDQYNAKLSRLRKHMVYYADMKPYENKEVRGDFFFKRARRICRTEQEFLISFLNHDPGKIEQTFYPTLTYLNKYKAISDYDPRLPIIGAMDYNFAISPLPLGQYSVLPNKIFRTLNIFDYMYDLHPLGMEDTLKAFCEKYKKHENKEFHYIHDHTSIGRSARKGSYKELFIETLDSYGWDVVEHYIGQAPEHENKFEKIKRWLARSGQDALRIHEIRCEQLLTSIEKAPAKIERGATHKDKSSEKKYPEFPAEDSTHGSDAVDQILWWAYELDGLSNMNDEVDTMKS